MQFYISILSFDFKTILNISKFHFKVRNKRLTWMRRPLKFSALVCEREQHDVNDEPTSVAAAHDNRVCLAVVTCARNRSQRPSSSRFSAHLRRASRSSFQREDWQPRRAPAVHGTGRPRAVRPALWHLGRMVPLSTRHSGHRLPLPHGAVQRTPAHGRSLYGW